MCGLPSTRATSGRAANASATCRVPFTKIRINYIKRAMLEPAIAQPLQNRTLCCLGLVLQSLVYESPLFSLGRETRGRAQVGLVRKHNEKFGLLAISGVFHHPRRDLVRRSESAQ